ncbi:MAG: VPLPA-CTERM sorting domain-containing protein [Pseudomonadota bacterium]
MLRTAILSLAVSLGLVASSASAAVIGTFSNDYGPTGIQVSEADEGTVFDSFDFSSLAGQQVDSLSVSVTFADAGPSSITIPGFLSIPLELWTLGLSSGTGSIFTDTASVLVDAATGFATLTRTINAATDAASGESLFADALSSLSLGFGFEDTGLFFNDFTLSSASLSVEGTAAAVVPLPAPVWLLLTALGGLGLAARRQTNRFQTASSLS